jgi:hypothetical protein
MKFTDMDRVATGLVVVVHPRAQVAPVVRRSTPGMRR